MKYNRLIIALVAISCTLFLNGQNLVMHENTPSIGEVDRAVLDSVETNNTTLIALRAEIEARKLGNRTGITLADPEVGYKRMWEGAEQTGNLTELTIGQSFDLATVLGYRSRTADSKNRFIDAEYRIERMNVLLETQLLCIDIAYYQALRKELERRLVYADKVVKVEKQRLDVGDTDALSYNNILLNFSALEAEMSRVDTELRVLSTELIRLNGGQPISFTISEDAQVSLSPDFDSWYAEALALNPELALAKEGRELAKKELTLSKSNNLPTLSATYINERHTVGSRSQGVAVGINLPLWANKNGVRSARASLRAAEAREADVEQQLKNFLQAGYERVKGLQQTATLYRRSLGEANNTELLQRAMDEGYISVLEYLQGIELYYDYLDRSLNAEREYRRALAELDAWKL